MTRAVAFELKDPDRARWTDSHCHLQDLDDLPSVLTRARDANVNRLICIGTSYESSVRALELAAQGSDEDGIPIWATVGQHPHEASAGTEEIEALLESSPQSSRAQSKAKGSIVAVGECGLDYHYDYSPRDAQRLAFVNQIRLAVSYDLALVVHTREAWEDTFHFLETEPTPNNVIIHCFTGGPKEAKRCLDLGAYLSFSGIATFKNAADVREAAVLCPVDRMLVETDAPYLAPVPHRGSSNEPGYVALVGEAIAALKGIPASELARRTSDNATNIFGLAT